MFDIFHEIGQTLRQNKLRTALTGLSVSWGVFMLIVLLGVARGVTNAFEYNMNSSSQAKINLWGGSTSRPYHGNREGRSIRLETSDIATLEQEHPDFVESATSSLWLNSSAISSGTNSVTSSAQGVFPSELERGGLKITAGRNINQRDLSSKEKVMVLPSNYADQLFPPGGEAALGQRVRYLEMSFVVVGVYESRFSRNVYVPFTTAQTLSTTKDRLNNISVNLRNVKTEEDGTRAEDEIRATMAHKKDFDPTDTSAIYVFNAFKMSLQGAKVMGILGMAVWVLGLLTLLTGVVGISNIMFVSVRERTHEIGIRRAIGAKPRSVLAQVIVESVAITLVFGYVGIVLGMVVTQIIGAVADNVEVLRNPTVNLSIAVEVTAVLVVAGALAGLFPALKALKVKPVEALRDE